MSGVAIVVGFVVVAFVISKVWEMRGRKSEERAAAIASDVASLGDDAVPASIHPAIDPHLCIGSGACVAACPEDDVIAVVKGRAELINPLACIGHGACAAACPVDAISLVFGTAKRGFELPALDESFQTSQPGVYVAGELGGMGLLRNAVVQGRQVGEKIVASSRRGKGDVLDAIVVGAGAAGISATLAMHTKKLNVLLLDREEFGGTILHYPRAKVVMTGTLDIPGHGKVRRGTMSKEQLVEMWTGIREKFNLPFLSGELVTGVTAAPGGVWKVTSNKGERLAANVVLALGRRGSPRKLGVPGEDLSSVSYRLIEPDPFKGKHVVVVGGGNAAADSIVALGEAGFCKSVTLSYRRAELARLRGSVKAKVAELAAAGKIRLALSTEIKAIEPGRVMIVGADKTPRPMACDAVIVQAGGTSPIELLTSAGVKTVVKHGEA